MLKRHIKTRSWNVIWMEEVGFIEEAVSGFRGLLKTFNLVQMDMGD